jgi:hypothetical protein
MGRFGRLHGHGFTLLVLPIDSTLTRLAGRMKTRAATTLPLPTSPHARSYFSAAHAVERAGTATPDEDEHDAPRQPQIA